MANGVWTTSNRGSIPQQARGVKAVAIGANLYSVQVSALPPASAYAGTVAWYFTKFDTITNIPTNLTPPPDRTIYKTNYGLAYNNIDNKIILSDSFYTTVGESVPSSGQCAKYCIYDIALGTWSAWQNWANCDIFNATGGTAGMLDIHYDNGNLFIVMEKGIGINTVSSSGNTITATAWVPSTYGNLAVPPVGTSINNSSTCKESQSIKVGNLICISGLLSNVKKIAKFNITTNTTTLSIDYPHNIPTGGISSTVMMNFGSKIYCASTLTQVVWNGSSLRVTDDDNDVSSMRIYDVNTNTWNATNTTGTPLNPIRHSATGVTIGGKSYIVGGMHGGGWGGNQGADNNTQVRSTNTILSYGYDLKAPSGVSSSVVNDVNVRLQWVDNSDEETNYVIYRKADNESEFTTVATLPAGTTFYVDTTSDIITRSYTYRIIARLVI